MIRSCLVFALPLCLCAVVHADGPTDNNPAQVRRVPRIGIEVPDETANRLTQGLTELLAALNRLKQTDDPRVAELIPDVEIYYRAVHDALKYQEFFKEDEFQDALDLLEAGRNRAEQLLAGQAPWTRATGLVVRGYVSKIDRSVQPYGLVIPESYAPDAPYRFRCDVWFHGRGETLSENNFLTQRAQQVGVFSPEDTIVLHPYGRYCNAFKFAGEIDVLEALESVKSRYRIDENRISVRGFSMGGAACWQFAVHYADRWFAANPGAGFAETPEFLKFFQQETLAPTWYEEELWRMYDCNLWSTNLLHCPTVAYSGEKDIQKQAGDLMATALAQHGVDLVHVVGPNMGHRYDPDSAAEVEGRLDSLAVVGRQQVPEQVHFTTYSLRYNRMHWLQVDELEEHWEPATITARITNPTRIDILTKNVTGMTLLFPSGMSPLSTRKPARVFVNDVAADIITPTSDRSALSSFHQVGDSWISGRRPGTGLRKQHGLQGPVDDALMDSFLFVRPTGKAWHPAIASWCEGELERAIEHWRRHFRGYAPVKDDTEVNETDIATTNLILWGDPASNSVLGRIANELPIEWVEQQVAVGDHVYPAEHHAVIAIYPNPLNPNRYVVLNSSFTFRDFAYLNNARQVPKLPDWAVVDVRTPPDALWPGKIVNANFFDEQWRLKQVSPDSSAKPGDSPF